MLVLIHLSYHCPNLPIVIFMMVLNIYFLSMGSDDVYIITLFLSPKGSDDLLVSHRFPAVLVCGEW